MFKKISALFLTLLTTQAQAGVKITEVMQSNFGGVVDYYNEYPDSWVEVYNPGNDPIDLKGYKISEKNDINTAYSIPTSFEIPADGYFLIFCDDENFNQHANFKLNTDKPGTVYLWDSEEVFQDSLHYPEMISPEVSWGRLPDIPDSLSHFRIATPAEKNNNTNTERVMKKVDFSETAVRVNGEFFLKLALKGDVPADAVIHYTTNGSEPNENSPVFHDSIYIYKSTVVRAKPFSDSAISKISKTHTYLFDCDNAMPIIALSCDYKYLYDNQLGILTDGTYARTHPDNRPPRGWMGDANYLYDWHRPINVEFYSGDSLKATFNQLAETRICGNVSRKDAKNKSMVIYAHKRFGDKHFKGTFWENLKPGVDKQKSMSIRNSTQNEGTYAIIDMLSQTAIGKVYKYYDVDFQAQRNVQLVINGIYKDIMHLQERDNKYFIWANHKATDVECIETKDNMYEPDEESFPNYVHFKKTYQSPKTTYQQMDNLLDINEFMNYVSTQAYFVNLDYPYNNVSIWYDKQGTKKWRWILKDLDAGMYSAGYNFYNFLLRVEPFDFIDYANTEEACELYQKMFSFNKFKQPYIDRTCVLAGTAFSKNTLNHMLDSIVGDMSLAKDKYDYEDYLENLTEIYDWMNYRPEFYNSDLSQFFGLGDTTKMTIRSVQNDSLIYVNNNPLVENKFDGYFFVGRDLYLTHNNNLDIYGLKVANTDEISYLDLGKAVETSDSASTHWTISYLIDEQRVYKHYTNVNLRYQIPEGANDVYIFDGYVSDYKSSVERIPSRCAEDLTYAIYSTNGAFIGKFDHNGFKHFKQTDAINIVVVFDETGKRFFSFKLLKK